MRSQTHQNEPIAREFAMLTCCCLKMSQKDPLPEFVALIFQLRLETWYQLGSPDSYWAVLDPLKQRADLKRPMLQGVAPFSLVSASSADPLVNPDLSLALH